ncbi:MAG: hypothetical protein ACRDTC_15150 [Pseudonocardiaceae bacterium]
MPIRTHRGRAAVYRTFWGWPLRSPKHLAGAVLIFIAVAAGLALVLPGGGNGPSTAASSSTTRTNPFDPASRAALPGANAAKTSSSPPSASAGPGTPPEVPAEALAVANAWVRAFLTTPEGISSAQWAEQMRRYTTEEGLSTLQSIDPENVPEAQIIGAPRPVSSGAGKAEVDVPTTAVVMRLLLVPTSAGWRVAGFEQAG